MQTRRTSLDHHHQGLVSTKPFPSPEAELIALARGKGQALGYHTLRLIRDTLELRGVTLEEFVTDVRPHFKNNILNPSGFLIHRARRFHELSRSATVRLSCEPVREVATATCEDCKGQQLVLNEKKIEPCPRCATPEFKKQWDTKEAERALRIESAGAIGGPSNRNDGS